MRRGATRFARAVFDPEGERIGTYNSTWRRDADGEWRIIFDNGCP